MAIPPIVYIGFDMAHLKRSHKSLALDRLKVIAEECLRYTGLFFSTGHQLANSISYEESIHRTKLHMGSKLSWVVLY